MQNEIIIETKTCRFCSASFDITDKDLEFYNKVSPTFSSPGMNSSPGLKYSIPSPTLCPDCRQQRRLSFRNERNLYKRKCDLTGKDIISIYSPDKKYKVYEQSEWWSDKWNPLDYCPADGIDFGRSFFEQFEELMISVPKINICGFGNKNCDFTNYLGNSKNCYLTFAGVEMENIFCSFWIANSINCLDCYKSFGGENLYECVDCKSCTNSVRLYRCQNCMDSFSLVDCIGCKECIGCFNLTNKEYHIFNKKYSKKEYFDMKKNINFNDNYTRKISKALNNISCDNCFGDYLINCKDATNCFDCEEIDECRNITFGWNMNRCYDIDYDSGTSYCYEGLTGYKINTSLFVNYCNESSFLLYCSNCFSSSHCFGCDGLRNAQYCILNKQYTKEEYESLVPRIIEHMIKTKEWGEFFPSSISPFGYNETVAMEYYPNSSPGLKSCPGLKSSDLERMPAFPTDRFKWSYYENSPPIVSKTIPASKLPDDIKDIPDDILNWAILPDDVGNDCIVPFDSEQYNSSDSERCNRSLQKPFRIIKQELEFYRKHNLPIPKRHPDQRHLDRMKLRNPRKLYDRLCDKCGIGIKTTYSPYKEEIVYCEECYLKEVV